MEKAPRAYLYLALIGIGPVCPFLGSVARALSLWINMKKITLLSLVALILMTALLGCNAFRGAGKDISDTGKHIENVGK